MTAFRQRVFFCQRMFFCQQSLAPRVLKLAKIELSVRVPGRTNLFISIQSCVPTEYHEYTSLRGCLSFSLSLCLCVSLSPCLFVSLSVGATHGFTGHLLALFLF